jgi:rhodanese-related sulfurtransferase
MEDISSIEFLKLLKEENHNAILLDVREEIEFHTYNVGGTHLPLGKLPGAIANDELDFSKDDTVIVICQRGIRSKTAKTVLEQNGYKNVRNLLGGLLNLRKISTS